MKVFISWSGNLGKSLAECLHSWLPQVIQACRPYSSADDIAKGARWSEELARELDQTEVGILVVTRESLEAPWLLFEAGALSKNPGRSRVVPLLFALEPSDLSGPLVQFQAAKFDRGEMKRVVRMLNGQLGDRALPSDVLDGSFDIWWPRLYSAVQDRLSHSVNDVAQPRRSDRALLEEVLDLVRTARASGQLAASSPDQVKTTGPVEGQVRHHLSVNEVRKRLRSGGNLSGAHLEEVSLRDTDFRGANLRGANMAHTTLVGSDLTNADLTGANLEGSILDRCDLKGTNLSRSNLWRASMAGVRNLPLVADITEANLFEVSGLSHEDEVFVSTNRTLALPDYPSFFAYYRSKGLTASEMSDIFLWTSTPGYIEFQSLFPRP